MNEILKRRARTEISKGHLDRAFKSLIDHNLISSDLFNSIIVLSFSDSRIKRELEDGSVDREFLMQKEMEIAKELLETINRS